MNKLSLKEIIVYILLIKEGYNLLTISWSCQYRKIWNYMYFKKEIKCIK